MADLYELLGVAPGATDEEIKGSYRKLARQLHPDANPDDPSAAERFKEVARAYEVLSDPEKRARYDRFGEAGIDGAGGGGDPFGGGLGDIFEAFFGGSSPFGGGVRGPVGPQPGPDLEVVATVPFEHAVFGAQVPVEVRTAVPCDTCEATGAAPGTTVATCPECGGAGQVRQVRQSILGQMVTAAPCRRCGGRGEVVPQPCADCRGEGRRVEERTYTVDVPAGVDSGATLRLSGRGAVGVRGGPAGDLYVHLKVTPHHRFTREGDDLRHLLHLSVAQAALGAHLPFETLDGEEDLVVPQGTQTGHVFRLRGRGVPHLRGRGRGDLLVEVVVDTPTDLSDEEAALLRRLAELRGEDVAPEDAGFFSRIRSAFR